MTVLDILREGYGIDTDTLSFEFLPKTRHPRKAEVFNSLKNNRLIIDLSDLNGEELILLADDFRVLANETVLGYFVFDIGNMLNDNEK